MHSRLPLLAYSISPGFAPAVFPDDADRQVRHLATPVNTPGLLPEGDLSEVRYILGGWGMPRLDEALLARLPSLEGVFYAAGSVRHFMTDAAWKRGFALSTAAEENGACVAEYCLAAALFSLKGGWRFARQMREQRGIAASQRLAATGLRNRVGLVSFGRIARRFCALLQPYPLEIQVWDPFVSTAEISAAGATATSLDQLFAQCDVVSVHTPLLEGTAKLIGEPLLRTLKPGATFLNTSRGEIVDETGLISVLRDRPDLEAVLDVTDPEPPSPDSPLFELPNVTLTPHIAGAYGPEARRLGQFAIDELHRHLAGAPLRGKLTQESARLLA